VQSLESDNAKLMAMLTTITIYIGKGMESTASRGRATRGVRVTANQWYALHGGAFGDAAVAVQNENAEKKAAEQAEKDAMAEAYADKRACDVGLATDAAMVHLSHVVLGGRGVLENLSVKDLKDIIISSDPDKTAPTGGKVKLLARVLTLPTVVQVLHEHAATRHAVMLAAGHTPRVVPMPAPPAPSPLSQPPTNTPPGPSHAFAELVNIVSATASSENPISPAEVP
jgi:hypothetical protein